MLKKKKKANYLDGLAIDIKSINFNNSEYTSNDNKTFRSGHSNNIDIDYLIGKSFKSSARYVSVNKFNKGEKVFKKGDTVSFTINDGKEISGLVVGIRIKARKNPKGLDVLFKIDGKRNLINFKDLVIK